MHRYLPRYLYFYKFILMFFVLVFFRTASLLMCRFHKAGSAFDGVEGEKEVITGPHSRFADLLIFHVTPCSTFENRNHVP